MKVLASFFSAVIPFLMGAQAQLTGEVDYQELGISFTIPDGWFGQEGDGMVILGSNTVPGLVLITTHTSTKQELINEARAGLTDQNGTNMKLVSTLEDLSENAVAGKFNGTMEYQPAMAYIIGLANPYQGMGVTIISVTTAEQYSQEQEKVAKALYKSFQFKKIEKSSELEEWKQWLSNVRLTYMDSYYSQGSTSGGVGGGYSSEERIDLCAQGYFRMSGSSSVSVSGDNVSGYNGGTSAGNGSWEVRANGTGYVLILTYNNGETASYDLEYKDSKLYLNGYRYYRTIEGEYAPNCP